MDFKLIPKIRAAVKMPLVRHGTCGISMPDITKLVKAGMTKINFGEGIRMNYIRYWNKFSQTLNHEHHAWRISRAAKDRLKEDIKDIIRACGSGEKPRYSSKPSSTPPIMNKITVLKTLAGMGFLLATYPAAAWQQRGRRASGRWHRRARAYLSRRDRAVSDSCN